MPSDPRRASLPPSHAGTRARQREPRRDHQDQDLRSMTVAYACVCLLLVYAIADMSCLCLACSLLSTSACSSFVAAVTCLEARFAQRMRRSKNARVNRKTPATTAAGSRCSEPYSLRAAMRLTRVPMPMSIALSAPVFLAQVGVMPVSMKLAMTRAAPSTVAVRRRTFLLKQLHGPSAEFLGQGPLLERSHPAHALSALVNQHFRIRLSARRHRLFSQAVRGSCSRGTAPDGGDCIDWLQVASSVP